MNTMMNRLSGTALLFVLMMGTAFGAADTGTISFSGTLTSSSCTVDAGGASVTLPRIPISILQTAGSTAGRTQFTITLSGCAMTGSDATVKIRFRNGPNIDQTTRNLKENSPLTHVQIQLLNSDREVINLVDNTKSEALTPNGANASFTLYAEYYAPGDGVVGAGNVDATLLFDLIYH